MAKIDKILRQYFYRESIEWHRPHNPRYYPNDEDLKLINIEVTNRMKNERERRYSPMKLSPSAYEKWISLRAKRDKNK